MKARLELELIYDPIGWNSVNWDAIHRHKVTQENIQMFS